MADWVPKARSTEALANPLEAAPDRGCPAGPAGDRAENSDRGIPSRAPLGIDWRKLPFIGDAE